MFDCCEWPLWLGHEWPGAFATVSDAWTIRVEWQLASSVNGPIERYLLYLSTVDESVGSVVYNTSHPLLFHTLNNLTAATQHFVRLAVSLHLSIHNAQFSLQVRDVKKRQTFVQRPIVRNSPLRCGSHSFHTANTPHLPLPVAFHQRAPLQCVVIAVISLQLTTHLSTPRGWKSELAYWLTYSGRWLRWTWSSRRRCCIPIIAPILFHNVWKLTQTQCKEYNNSVVKNRIASETFMSRPAAGFRAVHYG